MPTIMQVGFKAVLIPFNSPEFFRIDAPAATVNFGEYPSVSEDGTWAVISSGSNQHRLYEKVGSSYVFRDTEGASSSNHGHLSPDGNNFVFENTNLDTINTQRSGATFGRSQGLTGGTSNREDIPARDSNIFALDGDRLVLRSGGSSTDNWSFWTRSAGSYNFGAQLDIGNNTVGVVSVSHNGDVVVTTNDSTDQMKIWVWNGSTYIDTQSISSGTHGFATISSCALNNDGSVIAISGGSGGTKILVRSGTWSITQTLSNISGGVVSMSEDGLLAIGDSSADIYGDDARGVVHIHQISGTTYSSTPTSVVQIPAADRATFSGSSFLFGDVVRMAPDGSRMAVSARTVEHTPVTQLGSAYIIES